MTSKDHAVIVTSTFYDITDNLRINLAKETFSLATQLGYKIIAIDGGSPRSLLREFECLGAEVHFQDNGGMGEGLRQGYLAGIETGLPVIVRMEAEKAPLINSLEELILPIKKNEYDLVIPKRKSLESYPKFQAKCEELGNKFVGKLTGKHFDYWFGPRIGTPEFFEQYFMQNPLEGLGDKWQSLFLPVLRANQEEAKIGEIEVRYIHPKEQTNAEEGNISMDAKRIEQLYSLTNDIQKYWDYLKRS